MMIKECNQLIQQIDTIRDLVSEKEESKCNNVITWYKKWWFYKKNHKRP